MGPRQGARRTRRSTRSASSSATATWTVTAFRGARCPATATRRARTSRAAPVTTNSRALHREHRGVRARHGPPKEDRERARACRSQASPRRRAPKSASSRTARRTGRCSRPATAREAGREGVVPAGARCRSRRRCTSSRAKRARTSSSRTATASFARSCSPRCRTSLRACTGAALRRPVSTRRASSRACSRPRRPHGHGRSHAMSAPTTPPAGQRSTASDDARTTTAARPRCARAADTTRSRAASSRAAWEADSSRTRSRSFRASALEQDARVLPQALARLQRGARPHAEHRDGGVSMANRELLLSASPATATRRASASASSCTSSAATCRPSIVENNGVYGLTKGSSPTADLGSTRKSGEANRLMPVDLCALATARLRVRGALVLRRPEAAASAAQGRVRAQGHGGDRRDQPVRDVRGPRRLDEVVRRGEEHDAPLHDIDYVPYFEDLTVDYEPARRASRRTAPRIFLKKLDTDLTTRPTRRRRGR